MCKHNNQHLRLYKLYYKFTPVRTGFKVVTVWADTFALKHKVRQTVKRVKIFLFFVVN